MIFYSSQHIQCNTHVGEYPHTKYAPHLFRIFFLLPWRYPTLGHMCFTSTNTQTHTKCLQVTFVNIWCNNFHEYFSEFPCLQSKNCLQIGNEIRFGMGSICIIYRVYLRLCNASWLPNVHLIVFFIQMKNSVTHKFKVN